MESDEFDPQALARAAAFFEHFESIEDAAAAGAHCAQSHERRRHMAWLTDGLRTAAKTFAWAFGGAVALKAAAPEWTSAALDWLIEHLRPGAGR